MSDDAPKGLARNASNYGDRDMALYLRRSFMLSMGWSREALARPTVGICDTGSGLNNCHRHFPELVRAVERGVLAAGGLPLPFPTISVCEPSLSPCSMYYRNLAAIDTEEMMRASRWMRWCCSAAATRPCRPSSWPRSARTCRR